MAGPWEKYAQPAAAPASQGPWSKYASATPAAEAPAEDGGAMKVAKDIGRAFVTTARDYAQGAASIAALPVDAAIGVYNFATGGNQMNASQAIDKTLDDVGLPRTENAAIRTVNQMVGGALVKIPGLPEPTPAQTPTRVMPTSAAKVIQEGEKRGVPVFYDDVAKGAVSRRIGVAAEPLGPLGTGAGRAKQAIAADTAAKDFVQTLAPSASDDVPELVQKGLQTKLGQFRKTAGKLYTRAASILDPQGPVPTSQFDSALQAEIASQKRFGTAANQELISAMEKLQQAPRGDFSFTRELREQLANEISTYYSGGSAIGDKGVGALQAAKNALEADMASFAKQSGGNGYQAWKAADGFYKANIAPFKVAGFRDLAKSAEPEKAWRYLVSQNTLQSRADRLYNSLDEPGRAAVRYGLAKDAMDSARNPNGSFSPARFAKYLEDHDNAVQTFFKGTELREVEGFRNLMRHVERAGQFAENPPTGQRLIPYLALGGAAVSPEATAVAVGSGVTVRALFQTKVGRDLLLRMSRVDPGTAQAAVLTSRISRLLTASAGGIAAQGTSQADMNRQSRPAEARPPN